MPNNKIKITKQEFEDLYQIEDDNLPDITPIEEPKKEESVLTEQEQMQDDDFHKDYETSETQEENLGVTE